jgi:hypothetical protein
MIKESRLEIERRIVASVKKEMDKPRLTESVRRGFRDRAAPPKEKQAVRSPQA